MIRSFFVFTLLSLVLLTSSCRTDLESLETDSIATGYNHRLNDLLILSDSSWLICGGTRNESGAIIRTDDSGSTWSVVLNDPEKSLYALGFFDDQHGLCGGDYLQLWETFDGGRNWQFHWLADQVPYHEQDRPAIRTFEMLNDSTGYMAGGENYGEGVIYHTTNGGSNWQFIFDQHEFRDLDFSSDERGIVAGHGRILVTKNGFESLEPVDFAGEFFTSVVLTGNGSAVACGMNGGIYHTTDFGTSWNEILKSNVVFESRIQWNDLVLTGSMIVAGGNSGKVAISWDKGSTFVLYELTEKPNLYSLGILNNDVLACSDEGEIIRFTIP